MNKELKIIQNEDGTFSEYDDTFDITIHCQSEEEQNEVLAKLNAPQPNIGRWIIKKTRYSDRAMCSVCGDDSYLSPEWDALELYRYCPNCGADMRGDK